MESLHLLQRVAYKNCMQQLNMKPRLRVVGATSSEVQLTLVNGGGPGGDSGCSGVGKIHNFRPICGCVS